MYNKSLSFLIAGFLIGLFIATSFFSFYLHIHDKSSSLDKDIILKLPHVLDQSHPVHLALVKMAELLHEKSGGTVELQIFPNGQLGNETENIEQLQRGAIAMTKTSASPMEAFIPEMAVLSLPYLFRNEDHYWNVLNGPIGKKLLQLGDPVGIYGLCYYDSGSRNFYTVNTPILHPDNLKGKKIRVQKSRTSMDMVKALGGSPTPIPWGELYTALQQGMIDGAENNPPSFYTNRHFEVCKHFSFDEHTRIPDIILVSKIVWDSLPLHVKKWIQEAADESVTFQRQLWNQKTKEAIEEMKKKGVQVYYPEKEPFVDHVAPMYNAYKGTEISNMIHEIQQTP